MKQGGSALRGPSAVAQGGTIQVSVGAGDSTVEVTVPGVERTIHEVPPNSQASVPVPNVPPGTIVIVRVGRGLRAKSISVEVVAPGP